MTVLSVAAAAPERLAVGREQWNDLARAMPYPTPFSSWDWQDACCKQFGQQREPRFLLAYEQTVLRGILPLTKRTGNGFLERTVGVWELLAGAEVGADHLDVIAPGDYADTCAGAIRDLLAGDQFPWHVLSLRMVTREAALVRALSAASTAFRCRFREISLAPYLPLVGDFDQYLASLSRNARTKLRTSTRKLLGDGRVQYVAFERSQRDEALGLLFELHAKRFTQRAQSSTLLTPEVHQFHRELLERLPWDRVVLRGLKADGQVIAMFYGFEIAKRMFYFQLGYDPNWSRWSPGIVLITETIREAFARGCTEYNFLQGTESFKRLWTSKLRRLYELRVYRRSLRGNLAHAIDEVRDRLRQVARTAPRTGEADDPEPATST